MLTLVTRSFRYDGQGSTSDLTLLKRIIESHRGTVVATSRQGSTALELEWPVS